MPAQLGRTLVIAIGGTPIAAVQSKSMTVNDEPVDITSDDDSGERTVMSESGLRSVDLSVEGVQTDDTLKDLALGSGSRLISNITITWDSGDTLAGSFYLASYEESGASGEDLKFSASLQSSGALTFTPA